MYTRDVMKLLVEIGICREYTYPYGKIEDKKYIPEKIYKEAKSHTIKAYAKVKDLEKTKRCLYENGPCFISFSALMDEQLTTKGPQVCGSTKIFSIVL